MAAEAPFLAWTEAHRIGVPMLDYEHQDLFARLSELDAELLRHDERAKIEACLGEIHARMAAHFALEERFMREKKHPDLAAHKAEHDALLDEFVEFMARFSRDPELAYGEAERAMLRRWVNEHVLRRDRHLGRVAGDAAPG